MWPKFGNSSISMREVITSISLRFKLEKTIFWGVLMGQVQWFRTGTSMTFIFYTNVAKELKLKFRKFLGLTPTFVEVTGEKRLGGLFASTFWIGLIVHSRGSNYIIVINFRNLYRNLFKAPLLLWN